MSSDRPDGNISEQTPSTNHKNYDNNLHPITPEDSRSDITGCPKKGAS